MSSSRLFGTPHRRGRQRSRRSLHDVQARRAHGDGHEKGLDAETLQDLLDAGWFHTDHVFSCTGDDPENFILMPKTLNMKFSFHTEQDFKKEWTGDAWKGAEYLVRKAIHMQQRIHRH